MLKLSSWLLRTALGIAMGTLVMAAAQAAAKDMQEQVVKLDAAAKSGNLDAIKAAVGDTGKACKACHDDFREK